jgi:hypothetical protein
MIPWIAKIAANSKAAESGDYTYEITASHYVPDSKPAKTLMIKPAGTKLLDTGYDLAARYDPGFAYPKTLTTGSYAIVLVLKPEIATPGQTGNIEITTDPFAINVPEHPRVTDCRVPHPFGFGFERVGYSALRFRLRPVESTDSGCHENFTNIARLKIGAQKYERVPQPLYCSRVRL